MESRWPFIPMNAEKQKRAKPVLDLMEHILKQLKFLPLFLSLSCLKWGILFGGRYLRLRPFFLFENKWCLGGSVILFR
jgi:hypothetical protein